MVLGPFENLTNLVLCPLVVIEWGICKGTLGTGRGQSLQWVSLMRADFGSMGALSLMGAIGSMVAVFHLMGAMGSMGAAGLMAAFSMMGANIGLMGAFGSMGSKKC
jgi:hypothetical protein